MIIAVECCSQGLGLAVRPRTIGRNIVGQQIPTLSVECYMPPFAQSPCCMLLRVVRKCCKKFGRGGGGGRTASQGMGRVFRDFCLEQGIEFIIFCLNHGIDLSIFVLNWVKCLKQGIKNRNSVLKWVGKLAIFVLNRVRV